MTGNEALRQAVDLVKVPSGVRRARREPLPEGLPLLLRLAAGEALEESEVRTTGHPPELLREAATFYIEQILLAPGSDNYRVLGCMPEASQADLRRNMALLLRCLHPDKGDAERSVFAARVTAAWNQLKTEDRRSAYDHEKRIELAERDEVSRYRRMRHRRRRPTLLASGAAGSVLSRWQRILRFIGR